MAYFASCTGAYVSYIFRRSVDFGSAFTSCLLIFSDLIYGTGNPFAVKKIFVLSPADVIKYCRKKFTIVVVDNCSDEDLNRFININLLADFKIWINSKDLKVFLLIIKISPTWK